MLYNIISGLRLHVTGLMNNADNLITIRSASSFLPKLIFFLNGKFTDPAFIPSIVQLEVAHFSAKCVFTAFAMEKLNLCFSAKQNPACCG